MPPKVKGALTLFPPQVCDGHPNCDLAAGAGPSHDEQGCGAWGPWGLWGTCSQTCGPGVQGRSRRCSPSSLPVLQHCPGPEHQTQACFTAACPGEGLEPRAGQWCLQRAGERTRGRQPSLTVPPPARPLLLTVDGEWTSWSPWSSCSEPCGGTMSRQRRCHPPQNGGRTCAMLPGGPHSTYQTSEWKGAGHSRENVGAVPVGGLFL